MRPVTKLGDIASDYSPYQKEFDPRAVLSSTKLITLNDVVFEDIKV